MGNEYRNLHFSPTEIWKVISAVETETFFTRDSVLNPYRVSAEQALGELAARSGDRS